MHDNKSKNSFTEIPDLETHYEMVTGIYNNTMIAGYNRTKKQATMVLKVARVSIMVYLLFLLVQTIIG
jgi:hypothetical protein